MAPEETKTEGEAPAEKARGGALPWILVTLLCGGAGVAIPFFLPSSPSVTADDFVEEEDPFELPAPEDTAIIPFESVVVNLDEGAMTRYLRVTLKLQVAKDKELMIVPLIEEKKALLKNWLLNQISDKGLDDIRGAAGQNRLRREIRDQFNSVLFPDGYDRIYDVLFDEYNVQ
ncbi:MAG: flagellar basal body-associated FliL family protein [Fuerstiella sp.]